MGSPPTAEARIAVDAMSGDLGPVEVVAAVKLARDSLPQLPPITLVGDTAVVVVAVPASAPASSLYSITP